MPAHGLAAPEPAFGNRYKNPVSVEFHAGGEVVSTGFSFEDYHFAQTRVQKQSGERRLPTPSWAFNFSEQRLLLARFMEWRAGIIRPRIDTPEKRLRYAYRRYMRVFVPSLRNRLERLCHEFVTCQDPKRRRTLEIEIESIDTQLRVAKQGPALIVGIIHHYFGAGLDSVGTAAEFGIRPPSVRQIIWRLHKTWRAMVDGTDRKPKPEEVKLAKLREKQRRWREEHPEEYKQRKAEVQAYRDANREVFRQQQREWYARNRDMRVQDKAAERRSDPEAARQRAREWAQAHPDRVRETQRRFRAAHPDYERQYYRKHRKQILERQKARRATGRTTKVAI